MDFIVSKFGWTTSKRTYMEVMECVNSISVFPEIGVLFEGIAYHGNEVRMFNIRQNAIVYSVDCALITIIVFWDNRQNPACLAKLIENRKL